MLEARFFPSLLRPATIGGIAPAYAIPVFVVAYGTLLTQGLSARSLLTIATIALPLYFFGRWATDHDPFAPQALLGSAAYTQFFPSLPFE